MVARQAHNLKVIGSNPIPAPIFYAPLFISGVFFLPIIALCFKNFSLEKRIYNANAYKGFKQIRVLNFLQTAADN